MTASLRKTSFDTLSLFKSMGFTLSGGLQCESPWMSGQSFTEHSWPLSRIDTRLACIKVFIFWNDALRTIAVSCQVRFPLVYASVCKVFYTGDGCVWKTDLTDNHLEMCLLRLWVENYGGMSKQTDSNIESIRTAPLFVLNTDLAASRVWAAYTGSTWSCNLCKANEGRWLLSQTGCTMISWIV